jgi:hypothetical protein
LSVAATDAWTLAIATFVAGATYAHRTEFAFVPWWAFAMLFAAAVARIAFLLFFNRDRLLIIRAWGKACRIAAGRCPNREV